MKKIIIAISLSFLCLLIITRLFAANGLDNNQPTIVFATTEAYAPYAAVDSSGHVYGFSIAFSQMLCAEMKANCIYKPMVFDAIFPTLAAGKVDAAIGAISITKEREEQFVFTLPYLPTQGSLLGKLKPGQKPIKSMTPEIALKHVFGVQKASVYQDTLIAKFPNIRYKSYDSLDTLLGGLLDNEVDFIILDTSAANYWANQTSNRLYVVGDPYYLKVGIGIMLNKGETQLLAKLNRAIHKVTRSKDYDELLKTFFPVLSK